MSEPSACPDCSVEFAGCSRVSALSVAGYDWLWTLPIEFDIYRLQTSIFHLSRICILFILIRYSSIAVLVIGNVGYFKHGWPASECEVYYYFSPLSKMVQMASAGTILFIRTWAISRRSKRVFYILLSALIVAFGLGLWTSIYRRIPVQGDVMHCVSADKPGTRFSWIFYLLVTLYDLACLVTATFYLYHQSPPGTTLHGLSGRLLKEGILYFAVLLVINLINLIIYLKGSLTSQPAAASWGNALTWIMAQRILIQLHRLRCDPVRGQQLSNADPHGGMLSRDPKFATPTRSSFWRSSGTGFMSGDTSTRTADTAGDIALSGVHIVVHVEQHRDRSPSAHSSEDEDDSEHEVADGKAQIPVPTVDTRAGKPETGSTQQEDHAHVVFTDMV